MKAQLVLLIVSALFIAQQVEAYCYWKGNAELKQAFNTAIGKFYSTGDYIGIYNKYFPGSPLQVGDIQEKYIPGKYPSDPIAGGALDRIIEEGVLYVELFPGVTEPNIIINKETGEISK